MDRDRQIEGSNRSILLSVVSMNMNERRRNPYLILGVHYGTGRDEATRAFARMSKRARRDGHFPHTIEDLTWALNQIKSQIENPTSDLTTFRVPADPDVMSVPPLLDSDAFAPKPIERRTPPVTQFDLQNLMHLARLDLIEQIANGMVDSIRKTFEIGVVRPSPRLTVSNRPNRPKLRVFTRKAGPI